MNLFPLFIVINRASEAIVSLVMIEKCCWKDVICKVCDQKLATVVILQYLLSCLFCF